MEVTITSEELVKPSSPTLHHLKTFKLCLLDQLTPFPHTPGILFYAARPGFDVRQKLDILKRSLSLILTRFYPLAGKIGAGGLYVECDDEGARFVEARVNMSLTQFLTSPDLTLLNKLIPCEFSVEDSVELARASNVQVSVFECGGIAVAVCNSHKLHDGTAAAVFLKEWTEFARRGGGLVVGRPEISGAVDLFPAKNLWLKDVSRTVSASACKFGSCVTRRFLFGKQSIEALRALGKGPNTKNPTQVEAVSGFLWKCAMDASRKKNDNLGRPSAFTYMVNIRNKTNPPLSEYSLGSLIWWAIANFGEIASRRADDALLPNLIGELRGAMSKLDSDFLSGLSRDKSSVMTHLEKIGGSNRDFIACSSWCRSGFYDADFGWGKPVWISSIGWRVPIFINFMFLIDTRSGDGIEAWVTLDEEEMSLMEKNSELRSFASVDPSPLTINSKL